MFLFIFKIIIFVVKSHQMMILFRSHKLTLAVMLVVDSFVGDIFETVDFGTLSLSETAVFGLLKVVERAVAEVAVADLRRDVVDDDTVDVAVFDVAVVLVDGLDTVLKYEIIKFNNYFLEYYYNE